LSRPSAPHRRRARAGELARGLTALLAVLVLLIGVPAALATVIGWPLPHTLPTLEQLRRALTTAAIPDEAFPKALAVLAWAYWLHFVLCLAAEVVAVWRGRVTPRIPLAGLNQAVVSRLVGAILLLAPVSGASRPVAAEVPPRPTAIVTTVDQHRAPRAQPTPATPATTQARPVRAAEAQRSAYVVQPDDTLWDIAERHLGDPNRWPEIYELNKGRRLPDPPGGRFVNPDLIYPGQVLRLPADAEFLGSRPPEAAAPPAAAERRPGKPTAPSPARHGRPAEPAPPSTTTTAAGTDQPPGRVAPPPAAPTTPPTSAPAPSRPAPTSRDFGGRPPPPPQTRPAATTTATTAAGTSTSAAALTSPGVAPPAEADPAGDVVSLPVALTSAALLAAGIGVMLLRLRRVQQRHRRPRRRIRLPNSDHAARAELALRVGEDPEAAAFLDLALRVLAAGLRRDRLGAPAVLAVQLSTDAADVLLDSPTAFAPHPFYPVNDGWAWRLNRPEDLHRLEPAAAGMPAPLPGLVTFGRTGTGMLLLNLEAPGLIALAGDLDIAQAVLTGVATELATSIWGGFFELILVGFGAQLSTLERVRVVGEVEEVLAELERKAQAAADLVAELGCGSVLGGRVAGLVGDSWTPTLVLCAAAPPPAALIRLQAATVAAASTVAAVVVGEVPTAPWQLTVDPDWLHIGPLGLDVQPQGLSTDDYRAVAALLETATDRIGVDPSAPPYGGLPDLRASEPVQLASDPAAGAPDLTVVAAPDPLAEAPEIDICVLGPIELHGVEIHRGKSRELLVALALHPAGMDTDQLWETLWPGASPVPATLHSTTSVARSALGTTPDGEPRLPYARGGTYRLHPSIGLDAARFAALVARGYQLGTRGISDLRRALELVRGEPFAAAGPRSYQWAVPRRYELEAEIVDAAERLGRLCLDAADPRGAQWAARQGLLASPFDERLYRLLMLAADAAGNPQGVEAVWAELGQVLEVVEPEDSLHPETLELYERLRRPARRRTGA
jgi:DNA-binding SARP family transcriptional activator